MPQNLDFSEASAHLTQTHSFEKVRELLADRRLEDAIQIEYRLWRESLEFIKLDPANAQHYAERALETVPLFLEYLI